MSYLMESISFLPISHARRSRSSFDQSEPRMFNDETAFGIHGHLPDRLAITKLSEIGNKTIAACAWTGNHTRNIRAEKATADLRMSH